MRTETYYSSVFLFISGFILSNLIISSIEPDGLINPKTKKLDQVKVALYSAVIALVLTLIVAFISEKLDNLAEKK